MNKNRRKYLTSRPHINLTFQKKKNLRTLSLLNSKAQKKTTSTSSFQFNALQLPSTKAVASTTSCSSCKPKSCGFSCLRSCQLKNPRKTNHPNGCGSKPIKRYLFCRLPYHLFKRLLLKGHRVTTGFWPIANSSPKSQKSCHIFSGPKRFYRWLTSESFCKFGQKPGGKSVTIFRYSSANSQTYQAAIRGRIIFFSFGWFGLVCGYCCFFFSLNKLLGFAMICWRNLEENKNQKVSKGLLYRLKI